MYRFFRGAAVWLLAVLTLAVFLLSACGAGPPNLPGFDGSIEDSAPTAGVAGMGAEIALITTDARLASAFGQGVQGTISRFAGESGMASATYRAVETDADTALSSLELAITGGARLVVAMDSEVSEALLAGVQRYPEIDFILFDTQRPQAPPANVVQVYYAPQYGGWLAGYAAAFESDSRLGLAGDESEEAALYALGFLAGVQQGAIDRGVKPQSLEVVASVPGLGGPAEEGDTGGASLAPENEEIPDGLELMLQEAPGLVFAAAFGTQAEVMQGAFAAEVPVIGIRQDLESTRFAATIQWDGKAVTQTLLEQWKQDALIGGRTIEGGVPGAGISLLVADGRLVNVNQSRAKQAANRFGHGDVAGPLMALQAESLASMEALAELFPHLVVRSPQPQPQMGEVTSMPISA